MDNYQLPPELENLDHALAARSTPQPKTELRLRITSGVHAQLRRERRMDYWRFAAAAALVAAVWMNLSLSAAPETDFHFKLAQNRPSIEQTARQIQELLPEMSETDARREALLLRAGGNLVMYPKITVSPAVFNKFHDSNGTL